MIESFFNFTSVRCVVLVLSVLSTSHLSYSQDVDSTVVIDFEDAEIGKHLTSWEEGKVIFRPAHPPTKNKSVARVMFFPHIASKHVGILNAVANETIPLEAVFSTSVKRVELTLWASTTSAAVIKAFDEDGELVDTAELKSVPTRKRPEDPVPFFKMVVQGASIASIQISGAEPGGFVVLDELRF